MQFLLRFRAPGDEKCNPYSVFRPRGPKNATPIAHWSPSGRNLPTTRRGPRGQKVQPLQQFWGPVAGAKFLQPLQHVGATGAKKRAQYNPLGPRGPKSAHSTSLWAPRGPKSAHSTALWGPGGRKARTVQHVGAPGAEKRTQYNTQYSTAQGQDRLETEKLKHPMAFSIVNFSIRRAPD